MIVEAEIQKLLSDGEEVVNMMQSRGWGIFQQKLTDKILDLQMIGNVEGATPEEKVMDMQARSKAVAILWATLNEIKGVAENHEIAKAAQTTDQDTGFVERQ